MLKALGKKPKENDELEDSGTTANSDFSNFTYNFKDNLKIVQRDAPDSDEDFDRNLDDQEIDISSPTKQKNMESPSKKKAKEEFLKI